MRRDEDFHEREIKKEEKYSNFYRALRRNEN